MDLTTIALIASIVAPAIMVIDRMLASRKDARSEGESAGGIKVAIELLSEVRADVRQIPALVQRVDTLENLHARLLSEHRQLRQRVDDTREKLASVHDGE